MFTEEANGPAHGVLTPGDRVGGKFVVRELLGNGSSARVYAAEHAALGTRVAVKVLHSDANWRVLGRFRREATVCGRIRSIHIPLVYDIGHLEDGSLFIIMEYLEGSSLEHVIRSGPLAVGDAVWMERQLLAGLDAVHQAGIVHRDVKPDNVVLHQDSAGDVVVKLIDFGISRPLRFDADSTHVTSEGMIVGTPCYMAPEQARGLPVDERTDVYAAGAVLYAALTGRAPFDSESVGDVLAGVVRDRPTPPSQHNPRCPAELEAVVLAALDKDPRNRPQSAPEMVAALDRIAPPAAPARPRSPRLASSSPPPRGDSGRDSGRDTVQDRPPDTVPFELHRRCPEPAGGGAAKVPLKRSWVLVMAALAALTGTAMGWLSGRLDVLQTTGSIAPSAVEHEGSTTRDCRVRPTRLEGAPLTRFTAAAAPRPWCEAP